MKYILTQKTEILSKLLDVAEHMCSLPGTSLYKRENFVILQFHNVNIDHVTHCSEL